MSKFLLIVETENNIKKEILLVEDDKKTSKLSLNTIDKFTSQFINEEELIKCLNKTNNDIKDINNVYIKEKDKNNYVEIAYSDKNILSYFEQENYIINQDSKNFKLFLYNFLQLLEDEDFFKFFNKSEKISNGLKMDINKRIKCGDYSNNCLYDISSKLSNYYEIRNIKFVENEYKVEKLKEKYNKLIEIDFKIKSIKKDF